MTGHWEMMGLHITKPFKTFTETGFPKELIDELEKRTGHKVIGNKSSSGTEILDELAEEEIAKMCIRDRCIYRSVRAHCTEFQRIPSASSVHTFRKAEQSFNLLDYERPYIKNCVNGAFMPPQTMPLTRILIYERILSSCSVHRNECTH